jgi:hypothetical protein
MERGSDNQLVDLRGPGRRAVRIHSSFLKSREGFNALVTTARLIVSQQNLKDGAEDELAGPRRERAVNHCGVNQRHRDQLVAEFREEPIDGGLRLRMGPIVTDTVAEAEMSLQPKLV